MVDLLPRKRCCFLGVRLPRVQHALSPLRPQSHRRSATRQLAFGHLCVKPMKYFYHRLQCGLDNKSIAPSEPVGDLRTAGRRYQELQATCPRAAAYTACFRYRNQLSIALPHPGSDGNVTPTLILHSPGSSYVRPAIDDMYLCTTSLPVFLPSRSDCLFALAELFMYLLAPTHKHKVRSYGIGLRLMQPVCRRHVIFEVLIFIPSVYLNYVVPKMGWTHATTPWLVEIPLSSLTHNPRA